MPARLGLWLFTTLLFVTHCAAAFGFYHAQLPPKDWTWIRQDLPSHGFIDRDAVRQAERWVLSHHDRWIAPAQETLAVDGQLSDGAQLTFSEGMDAIHMVCEGDQISLSGAQKSTHCQPESIPSERCHFVSEWRVGEMGFDWNVNGEAGQCRFRRGTPRQEHTFRMTLQSGVRPIWIDQANGHSVLRWEAAVIFGLAIGLGLWFVRKLPLLGLLAFSGFVSLVIPVYSPEYVAVLFRAPTWNHWALGLYVNLILMSLGAVLFLRRGLSKVQYWGFVGGVGVFLPLMAGNHSVFSVVAFIGVVLSFGWGVKAQLRLSGSGVAMALLAGLLSLEIGTRYSDTGERWLRDLGYAYATMAALSSEEQRRLVQLQEEYSVFEAGEFQVYPTAAFPVKFTEKGERPRIVAMGGSSTGGAYQMDDLSQFYPALLETRLDGRYEVLNQGVGGWTSYHIRRYLQGYMERLQPDILTLYISNNDAAKHLPADIESIYERLDVRSSQPPRISLFGPLRSVQNLVWLSERVAAVPPEKMGKNIAQIVNLIPESKRRILLMTELNHPDSSRLRHHHQRLVQMAEDLEGVEIWDGRKALPESSDDLFLDQVHLSEDGHAWLSQLLMERLDALGWLE